MNTETDDYTEKLIYLIEGFRFEACPECGNDLDSHTLAPDPLGNPHAYCPVSALGLGNDTTDKVIYIVTVEFSENAHQREWNRVKDVIAYAVHQQIPSVLNVTTDSGTLVEEA